MRGMSTFSGPGGIDEPNLPEGPASLSPGAAGLTEPVSAAEGQIREQRRMVIVPRRPGLLREFQAKPGRPRDELDEFIDELFGATTDEKPGPFDAGLIIVGLVLAAWAVILGGPSIALWFGIASFVLGLALPVRAALRRYGWSRSGGLRRRIIDGGLLLDASHPATVGLIDAYAHLIQMSCLQGTGDPKRAVAAGHRAIIEVATDLDGQAPGSPTKIRFVAMRREAIEALTRQMMRSHERWAARTATPSSAAPRNGSADGTASSWESLDALSRTGALAELEELNQRLRRETANDAD